MNTIKLTIQQWTLASLAGAVAVLSLLLVWYRRQLQATRVNLLSAHFENEQQVFDNKVAAAHEKVENSRRKYEDAISAYHNTTH